MNTSLAQNDYIIIHVITDVDEIGAKETPSGKATDPAETSFTS
ncbi:hypothetical protein [Evansella clarkii]|nr:hypothetical protein [Evansella clarkii]